MNKEYSHVIYRGMEDVKTFLLSEKNLSVNKKSVLLGIVDTEHREYVASIHFAITN